MHAEPRGEAESGSEAQAEPAARPAGFASRRERAAWLIGYAVVLALVGLGAFRQAMKLF